MTFSTRFPRDAWLARLGLDAPPPATSDGLAALHLAQAKTIPFENLDVRLRHGVSLAPEALVRKLLTARRGGYCFELNELLRLGLAASGFEVRALLARVLSGRPEPGPRSHEVLVVALGAHRFLADVGFGGPGLRAPLPLEPGRAETQAGEVFRLAEDGRLGLVLQKRRDEEPWADLYAFDPRETTLPIDIVAANHFTATWPGSPFRQHLMAARATETGRIALSDLAFDETVDGRRRTETVAPAALVGLLAGRFGLRLEAEDRIAVEALAAAMT